MSVLLVLRDSLQFAASCKIKWFWWPSSFSSYRALRLLVACDLKIIRFKAFRSYPTKWIYTLLSPLLLFPCHYVTPLKITFEPCRCSFSLHAEASSKSCRKDLSRMSSQKTFNKTEQQSTWRPLPSSLVSLLSASPPHSSALRSLIKHLLLLRSVEEDSSSGLMLTSLTKDWTTPMYRLTRVSPLPGSVVSAWE